MKRRLVYAFIAAVFAFMPLFASAQSGTVTGSGFQVQNLSDSQAATITVIYYSEASQAEVARTANVNVPAGGSVTFLDGNNGTLPIAAPVGFRGSVVIESNIPVAAITNLVGTNIGSSYSGFTSGSQRVLLPLITRRNPLGGGQFSSTSINVQNTGTTSANVTIAYTPGVAGAANQTDTATIAPGASRTFNQADKTGLGDRFVGSAVVTSVGGGVAVVVQQEGNTQLLSYDGFNNGATTVSVPLLSANNFGNLTGLQVQNAGTAAANVVIDFAPNTISGAGACGEPADKPVTLQAGASATFIQAGGPVSEGFDPFFASCRYVGGATIRNAAGSTQPLVAIVNQVLTGAKNGSAYESFDPAVATATNKAPLVFANNFGFFSGVQVQNAGTSAAAVTLTYGANTITGAGACPSVPTAQTRTVQPGASFTFIQAGGDAANGFDNQFATCRYVGSATISAPAGSKIVSIVNEANKQPSATSDTLFTYNAFNQ